MNFLPKEEIQKERQKYISIIILLIIVIQVPLFSYFVFYKPYIEIQEKQTQLYLLKQKLEDPKYQEILQKLALLEQLNQIPQPEKMQQWITKSLVETFFDNLSKDVSIEVLNMVEHQVTLKGRANEIVTILDYQQILDQIFGSNNVSSIFEPNQGSYAYEIVIQLNGEIDS